jgi:hypothetical protein
MLRGACFICFNCFTGTKVRILTQKALLEALLASSAAEYRVDLMAENLRGIPFIARTGANDEVV